MRRNFSERRAKKIGGDLTGPPLGRPPAFVSPETKKQALEDEKVRNSIEGKFGQGKRRFSLARVMAKLPTTSETAIAVTFLVMNLSTALRRFLCVFFCRFATTTLVSGLLITKIYQAVDERKHELIVSVA